VSTETNAPAPELRPQQISSKHITHLKIAGVILTLCGGGLFVYFVYSVGVDEILAGIGNIGFLGFGIILLIHFLRICARAAAWKLCVYEPYSLRFRDTLAAVIIGEATSSMIPLGILVSGTTKAVAVRKRVPLVVGLSSVATENLFYSIVTSTFLLAGAFAFLRTFELEYTWRITVDVVIAGIALLLVFIVVMVLRQWHFLSETLEWLYEKGIAKTWLENGRLDARLFENLIYGYYRRYPKRFLPVCFFETVFHILGVIEGWYILSKLSDIYPSMMTSFLLESVSRLITIVFKLVPFVIGVDEAGAQYITDTLAIGVGVGVMLAIIRKGRILFWTAIGILLIVKRGLSFSEITKIGKTVNEQIRLKPQDD
jgi:Lysylphosphatidylglycerol synthase TM region